MAFLSLAQLTVLAATCAPAVSPATIAAIARVESGYETNSINDNTTKKSYQPGDKTEAIELAGRLLKAGHSIDLGLMQINSRNFGWVGLTIEDAFEPCASIAAAQTILTGFSKYNTGSPKAGFANGYVARVLTAAAEIKADNTPPNANPPASPTPPPVIATPGQSNWNVFPPDEDVPSATTQSSESTPSEDEHDQLPSEEVHN